MDTTPPTFPESAAVVASVQEGGVPSLAWPPATDNVGVAQYRILDGNTLVQEVDGGTWNTNLEGLLDGKSYTRTILALDSSGNVSSPGLTTTFSIDDATPPYFPEGASLLLSGLTPTQVTLAWTAADWCLGRKLWVL